MKKRTLTIMIALAPLFLWGQDSQKDLRNYWYGRDGFSWTFYNVERIPDTVWLGVTVPINIDVSFVVYFDTDRVDTNYCAWGIIRQFYADHVWVSDESKKTFSFYNFDHTGWSCYKYEDLNFIDTNEVKQIIDTVVNLLSNNFIGCSCKICRSRYNKHKECFVPLKRYPKTSRAFYSIGLWVFPDERRNDIK